MPHVVKWELAYEDSAEAKGTERKYTDTYIATLEKIDTSPFHIFTYKDCPKYGERHPVDKAAFTTRVKPTRIGHSRLWKVVVESTTDSTSVDNNPNPLARPAVITWETRIEVVPTLFEANGRLRINPVGDLVPGKRKKPFRTYTIRKNVSQIPDWFSSLPGTTNQFDFYFDGKVRPKRTLQMLDGPKPEKELENGKWYYPLSFKIEEDIETYDVLEPATSFHELVQTGYINSPKGLIPEYTKKRILVGTPKEYAKDKQFIDKKGKAIVLQEDMKKGGIDVSKIYVQRRRDLIEVDYSVIQPTIT